MLLTKQAEASQTKPGCFGYAILDALEYVFNLPEDPITRMASMLDFECS